ncbi:protein dpy-30 [Marchantia polymorpha subsp. ruderalis]|uniref:Uncharacterized protein n=2 Tax=Marchantia polymorpha TaxID=3197 RepID=A0AAF6BNX6_MARPO|nr:hypothetical protein MARPO_0097s0073 [Marchantia polymorpha]BBN13710.1 hypothetical protein Mp_6g05690 [Marchantia polymorpha subsp. ruderalis]|eukprot:PTQ32602.1 hypothetical protein MARPO_0097s0073 [Marchantia polymorpha]
MHSPHHPTSPQAFLPWNQIVYKKPRIGWQPREFWFDVHEEELEAARIAEEEAARLELKAAPIREYLDSTVVPLLLKGLQILAVERPENPVDYLAQYLILKNPQPLPPPVEEVQVEDVTDEILWRDLEAELLPPPPPPARAASFRPATAGAPAPAAATRAASVRPFAADPAPAATRAASVRPVAADPIPVATRAASVRPVAADPAPPPGAATRAPSMKPAAPMRAASVKPAGEAPAAAPAATRAASVKPAADAVLGAAASRAASIKPATPAPPAATRAASVKPAAA